MARSTIEMGHPNVVSHAEWLAARREFLTKEKEFPPDDQLFQGWILWA